MSDKLYDYASRSKTSLKALKIGLEHSAYPIRQIFFTVKYGSRRRWIEKSHVSRSLSFLIDAFPYFIRNALD